MKVFRVVGYINDDPNSYFFGYELTESDAENKKVSLLKEGYTAVEIEQVEENF